MSTVSPTIVGMIHFSALPGSPFFTGSPSLSQIVEQAVSSAVALEKAGFTAFMIQNSADAAARKLVGPETVSALTVIAHEVRRATRLMGGICVMKNDVRAALAIAHICGLQFVRPKVFVGAHVGPEGLIEGCAEEAFAYRRQLGAAVEIWPDCLDLSSWPIGGPPFAQIAKWAYQFAPADRLIITGHTYAETLAYCDEVRSRMPNLPILIGGGSTPANVSECLHHANGVVVGAFLERERNGSVDPERAEVFMAAVRAATPSI